MLAIISFARKDSKRLPGKNMKILNKKPLIDYTLKTMKYLKQNIDCKTVVLTDMLECKDYCEENDINVIWRDHPKSWDDTRLNKWAHEKIKADKYLLLQPTNPLRDNRKILQWLEFCMRSNVKSAFSVYKKNRLNYEMNGNYFYYHYTQLKEPDLVDENSLVLIDKYKLDINTKEDFEKARAIYEN